jgi:hypothetical protein
MCFCPDAAMSRVTVCAIFLNVHFALNIPASAFLACAYSGCALRVAADWPETFRLVLGVPPDWFLVSGLVWVAVLLAGRHGCGDWRFRFVAGCLGWKACRARSWQIQFAATGRQKKGAAFQAGFPAVIARTDAVPYGFCCSIICMSKAPVTARKTRMSRCSLW